MLVHWLIMIWTSGWYLSAMYQSIHLFTYIYMYIYHYDFIQISRTFVADDPIDNESIFFTSCVVNGLCAFMKYFGKDTLNTFLYSFQLIQISGSVIITIKNYRFIYNDYFWLSLSKTACASQYTCHFNALYNWSFINKACNRLVRTQINYGCCDGLFSSDVCLFLAEWRQCSNTVPSAFHCLRWMSANALWRTTHCYHQDKHSAIIMLSLRSMKRPLCDIWGFFYVFCYPNTEGK